MSLANKVLFDNFWQIPERSLRRHTFIYLFLVGCELCNYFLELLVICSLKDEDSIEVERVKFPFREFGHFFYLLLSMLSINH